MTLVAIAVVFGQAVPATTPWRVVPDFVLPGVVEGGAYGRTVQGIGDINQDGYDDFAVAAPLATTSATRTGRVTVYFGGVFGPQAAWQVDGALAWDMLGLAVAGGDVNGDGYTDILLAGQNVYQLHLSDPTTIGATPVWERRVDAPDVSYGQVVAASGDANGDGYDDIAIGIREAAELYLGGPDGPALEPVWAAYSDDPNAAYGSVVAWIDANGDAFDDLLVGAPGHTSTAVGQGAIFIYFGSVDGLSPDPDWAYYGAAARMAVGRPLAVGAVNVDAYPDIVVGVPLASQNGYTTGETLALYGSAEGVNPLPAWSLTGEPSDRMLGFAVALAGDINQDSYADLIVGAPFSAEPARVIYGTADGPAADAGWYLSTTEANTMLGHAVAGIGDVNGDGFDDIAIGEPDALGGAGRALVYLGGVDGLPVPESAPMRSRAIGAGVADDDRDSVDHLAMTTSGALHFTPFAPAPDDMPLSGQFVDVSEAAGVVLPIDETFGPLWLDADGDGRLDLYMGNHQAPPSLYLNDGAGGFVESAAVVGLVAPGVQYATDDDLHGVSCADYDNDGDIDLYIARGANRIGTLGVKFDRFDRWSDGGYVAVDVATQPALNPWGRGRGAFWVDVDNDGRLDLHVTNLQTPNRLLRNVGADEWVDISLASGLGEGWRASGASWVDVDSDGWTDLLLMPDTTLMRNQGDGTFLDITAGSGLAGMAQGRLHAWADVDGDTHLDLLLLTTSSVAFWFGQGDGTFVEAVNRPIALESAAFADVDSDGDPDLLLLRNGTLWLKRWEGGDWGPSELVQNNLPAAANMADFAVADYDADGYLDIAVTGAQHSLLQNSGGENHWLQLKLVGTQSNRQGNGTRVTVVYPDGAERVFIAGTPHGGLYAPDCTPLHIGLGAATTVDLSLTWPSGITQWMPDVAADQILTIVEAP